MELRRRDLRRFLFVAALVFLAVARDGYALPAAHNQPEVIQVAQATEAPPRELQPRYEPVPPPPKSWYNDQYLFAATRGVANSTLIPALKAPLFILTVPVDLVCLPFAAVGGFF